jgi:YidC/Oxa1 family membrane protein insertase
MIGSLFHTVVYVPLYNALIAILDLGPWIDLGMAVILLTVVVKLILLPVSLKAARTQRLMKELDAPMKAIREKYKDDREEQGRKLLELYREKGVNPLSGFVTLLVQLPVIFGLYFVFLKGGLPTVDTSLLYSFIQTPHAVNMHFLGLVDLTSKSYVLAALAGISQYLQAHVAFPAPAPRSEKSSFQEDLTRSMQVQMKYMLPLVIAFVAYVASAAVALYWITSNIFAIGQELYVKRRLAAEQDQGTPTGA